MLDFGYAAADNLQMGLLDGSAPFGHVLQDRSCLSRGIPETRLGYAVHDSQLLIFTASSPPLRDSTHDLVVEGLVSFSHEKLPDAVLREEVRANLAHALVACRAEAQQLVQLRHAEDSE